MIYPGKCWANGRLQSFTGSDMLWQRPLNVPCEMLTDSVIFLEITREYFPQRVSSGYTRMCLDQPGAGVDPKAKRFLWEAVCVVNMGSFCLEWRPAHSSVPSHLSLSSNLCCLVLSCPLLYLPQSKRSVFHSDFHIPLPSLWWQTLPCPGDQACQGLLCIGTTAQCMSPGLAFCGPGP